ncbi:MAG: hypothetical protein R3B09_01680 [Nannocystaceae bacterium]
MTDLFESFMKGMLKTAESSVRSIYETEWTEEDHAAGRPMQEFLKSAARGLADTMSSVRASIPEIEPGKRSAESAIVADEIEQLRARQGALEEDQDELAEQLDRMLSTQHRTPAPLADEDPVRDQVVRLYRSITSTLHIYGATREEIRRCIQSDGKILDAQLVIPTPSVSRQVRRQILKVRRLVGSTTVEAVRDFIITPAVFSVLYTCVAAGQRPLGNHAEHFDA